MKLKSLDGCRLKFSKYPPFANNITRRGDKEPLLPNEKNNLHDIKFPSTTFFIPPLTSKQQNLYLFLYLFGYRNQSVNGSARGSS